MLMEIDNEQLTLVSKTPQHLRIFTISISLDAIETVAIQVHFISQAHQIAQMWKKKHKLERIFAWSATRVRSLKIN